MKLLLAILFFVAGFSSRAQTVVNTSNALHPLTKNTGRNAPTSLDQDPSEKASLQNTAPRTAAAAAAPAKPAVIVARIDPSMNVSKVSLIGTVSGIKGRIEVTNVSEKSVVPLALFAVCNEKGVQIGSTTKAGKPLGPNESERIEALGTNSGAVDLKLMKLTIGP